MLEDMGNAVKVIDTIVPATNIQIEDVPGYIDGHWYNPYFEVMFETGELWVVEDLRFDKDHFHDKYILIEHYDRWYRDDPNKISYITICNCWEVFLEVFEAARKS